MNSNQQALIVDLEIILILTTNSPYLPWDSSIVQDFKYLIAFIIHW